ncbi:MAG: threonylcarbamoyl-AMP synthase [Lachnospiraceae bacterium]|nr:threonylcarbamoyl-AMP synthase [Lachnospiraceae bacterium]
MNTIHKSVDPESIDTSVMDEAGSIIRSGGLVAFPTETVYGLGGDALNPASSRKIYEAKGRPSDNPLIVHIADMGDLEKIAEDIPDVAYALADRYWPGPLTMIFKKNSVVPSETTGGLDTVAVRFPSHPVAQAFIRAAGGYIAAPSANISGRPSPTTGDHVRADMDGRIDMIIDSGPCDIGLESTIIDLSSDVPMMLRPGFVSADMLREVLDELDTDPAVYREVGPDTKPKAPGMKYRHYAPKGKVTIVSGKKDDVVRYIREKLDEDSGRVKTAVLSDSDDREQYERADLVADMGDRNDEAAIASRLYDVLRKCDDEDIEEIYSEEFNTPQLGQAIMNRLIKAAGHNIVKV